MFPKYKVACAVMVLNKDNKVLLVQNPIRGWEFPGGYLEEGEAIKEAAVREVEEESGINIHLKNFCGIVQNIKKRVCVLLFSAMPISGELTTSRETLNVDYFTIDEALKKVTRKYYRDQILYCLDEKEHPFLIEI